MENKCNNCMYGAKMQWAPDVIFSFKEACKKADGKIKTINYLNGDSGCRMTEWNKKEKSCLPKFQHFAKFEIVKEAHQARFTNL